MEVAASIMPGVSSAIAAAAAPVPASVTIVADVDSARSVRPGGSCVRWRWAGYRILTPFGRRSPEPFLIGGYQILPVLPWLRSVRGYRNRILALSGFSPPAHGRSGSGLVVAGVPSWGKVGGGCAGVRIGGQLLCRFRPALLLYSCPDDLPQIIEVDIAAFGQDLMRFEIGRASCRERV